MLPQFWRSQRYRKTIGAALLGSCLLPTLSSAQSTPLAVPKKTEYPGLIQTFEKLIEVDNTKFKNRTEELAKLGQTFTEANAVTALELEPDFLNSIILHSDPGYLKVASVEKCRFYDTILTDLLKSAEGKIKNVLVTYLTKDGNRESAVINKKDFLNKVVAQECPGSMEMINQFQIKTLDQTLKGTLFEVPSGRQQCHAIHLSWVHNPKTPYLCQIHEYLKDAKEGNFEAKELQQKRAIAKIIEGKLTPVQRDYLDTLCPNLDNEDQFCREFLNVSFWNKVAGGLEDKIYVEDICRMVMGTLVPTDGQIKQCISRLKKENDLCLYEGGRTPALAPNMDCESLSTALNHSSLKSNYRDCPGNSDQFAATNLSRILFNVSKEAPRNFGGPCSAISAGETFIFNEKYDNDESWKLEACYDDKIKEREVCFKTFFGEYASHPLSYTSVVANILRETRGADRNVTCKMVDSQDYNPLLLEYKSGCYVIYERDKCHMSQCKHKIMYNDRPIDFIRTKGRLNLEYFPLSVRGERYSQHYLLTHDHKLKGRSLSNLTSISNFFKRTKKGIIHGVGCAEHLLPSFFKTNGMNQCTPLPFIIDGIIKDKDKTSFVTRTAADSLQAPRLISWSNVLSGVKTYQELHPLKLWTLYGLD